MDGGWLEDGCVMAGGSDPVLVVAPQEQVPAGTTSMVLRNLMPDTAYTVSVLPVYPAREGKRQSENGKTCEPRSHPHWTSPKPGPLVLEPPALVQPPHITSAILLKS